MTTGAIHGSAVATSYTVQTGPRINAMALSHTVRTGLHIDVAETTYTGLMARHVGAWALTLIAIESLDCGYEPPGGLIVNSPTETPSLSERARADWDNLDAQGHEASLRADIKASPNMSYFRGGLAQLRFYYPNAYATLSGEDAKKRDAFEVEEKMARVPRP
jgi:hypothetical protein